METKEEKPIESKEERLARQKKQWNKMVHEARESVMAMYARKVKIDAFYINYNNIIESVDY